MHALAVLHLISYVFLNSKRHDEDWFMQYSCIAVFTSIYPHLTFLFTLNSSCISSLSSSIIFLFASSSSFSISSTADVLGTNSLFHFVWKCLYSPWICSYFSSLNILDTSVLCIWALTVAVEKQLLACYFFQGNARYVLGLSYYNMPRVDFFLYIFCSEYTGFLKMMD